MPRQARIESQWKLYHVTMRGANRQIIFESNYDRKKFLRSLVRFREKTSIGLLAYCLMDNHVHLLIRAEKYELSRYIKQISDSYVFYYNRKYEKTGPLFEGRFGSQVIESEENLQRVIRYIHNNPVKAGISVADKYPWSSYDEYLGGIMYCDGHLIAAAVGDAENFMQLMMISDENDEIVATCSKKRKLDSEAIQVITSTLGVNSPSKVKEYPRKQRDESLRVLRSTGLSIRQIARLTGISRGVVERAIYISTRK